MQDRIQQIRHGTREVGYICDEKPRCTDYGSTSQVFIGRYENLLTHKTCVLIFGDTATTGLTISPGPYNKSKQRQKRFIGSILSRR